MAVGYTRQTVFVDGDVILAEHGNIEFNKLVTVFNSVTGHNHDSTAGGGAPIPLLMDLTLAQDLTMTATGVSGSVVLDEDNMLSNSATKLVTQQSVKAYVDAGTSAVSGEVSTLAGTLGTAATANTGTGVNQLPTTSQADARYLLKANNLSDLVGKGTARTNLGLGSVSTLDTGVLTGEVPTVDLADARYLLESNNLSDLVAPATARTNLGLGTAAVADVTTSSTDSTAGRLLQVGDFGLAGNLGNPPQVVNVDLLEATQIIFCDSTSSGSPVGADTGNIFHQQGNEGFRAKQTWTNLTGDDREWFRTKTGGVWGSWQEIYHKGNTGTAAVADVTTSTTDTTAGRLLQVGDFGLGGNAPSVTDYNTPLKSGLYSAVGASSVNYPDDIDNGVFLNTVRTNNTNIHARLYLGVARSFVSHSTDGGLTFSNEEIYHSGNDGGIVYGSNANGSYTKFPDGTLICRRYDSTDTAVNVTITSGDHYYRDISVTFPLAFVGTPSVKNASRSSAAITLTELGSSNNLSANLRFQSLVAGSINHWLGFIAIGRWK